MKWREEEEVGKKITSHLINKQFFFLVELLLLFGVSQFWVFFYSYFTGNGRGVMEWSELEEVTTTTTRYEDIEKKTQLWLV